MATNIKTINENEDNGGKVKVSNLPREGEALRELSSMEQRQIKGGTPRAKPITAEVPRPGGQCDDEFGCGTNHNETLVRDTRL